MSRNLIVFSLVIFFFYSPFAYSEEKKIPIDVYIYDRPPLFNIKDSNNVSGIIAELTAQAFETAKIPFRWHIVSSRAVLKKIEQNTQPLCATGWFKNAERELYAKYTLPIYQDGTRVILFRINDTAVKQHNTYSELMSDRSLKVGFMKGYSYGSYIDKLIKEKSPQNVMANQEGDGFIRMLLGERFDYFLLIEEQAKYLLSKFDNSTKIAIKNLSDASPGNFRYILCSLKTDKKIIQQLDSAIRMLKFTQ